MLISLNWIKDFVEIPDLSPKEIGSSFTLTTAEVEDIKVTGEGLQNVLCIQVISFKPHPDSDKLNLVTFDIGNGQTKEVVCGAPNVRVGLRAPFAPIGTTLPNGMTLEPKKIRGILSDGMLCSEVELGLGEGKSGLMELSEKAKPGMKLLDYLELGSDIILDVDNKSLTHRPDLWGYYGLAREFAAAHAKPLKNPFNEDWKKKIEASFNSKAAPLKVQVDQDSSCLAYLGISLNDIKVGTSSEFIQNRLIAAGLRPINSIVDISNYVMIELGIPNHIFDRDKIAGDTLFIKKAGSDQSFKTLDETERKLIGSDTIIADKDQTLVLAGIMGGLHSGVSETTKNIFIEVANWEAPEVRKTSVRLGLRSDSSQRYEKTLDSNLCYRTLLRLIEKIKEVCPEAEIVGTPSAFYNEQKRSKELTLTISHAQIISSLGMEISVERVTDIFTRLDFKVKNNNNIYDVTIPTYRTTKDIYCKADLIEEIGRMIGYDNITPVSPLMSVRPIRLSQTKIFHRKIQDFLVQEAKTLEIMTYPLTGEELLKKTYWTDFSEKMILVNALSQDADRMRPSIIPSAINMAAHNSKNFSSFGFFEIGRSYPDYEKEKSQLVIGLYSKEETRFTELLNHVEKLMAHLNINYTFSGKNPKFKSAVVDQEWKGLHPHEFVNIQIMGKFAGMCTTVNPIVLKNFKMKGYLSLAVIDMTDIESKEMKDKTKYHPIPKYPSSSFDFTVVASHDVPAGEVLASLNSVKMKELKQKSVKDVFVMNEKEKAVTLRAIFESETETLSAEFLKNAESQMIQALDSKGFKLRS